MDNSSSIVKIIDKKRCEVTGVKKLEAFDEKQFYFETNNHKYHKIIMIQYSFYHLMTYNVDNSQNTSNEDYTSFHNSLEIFSNYLVNIY